MRLKIRARTLVVNDGKVLLVKNKGMDFWYLPGGGWEYDRESIVECSEREVTEETGYKVKTDQLLWVQELHENEEKVALETFWSAHIADDNIQTINNLAKHTDGDPNGQVEDACWFTPDEVRRVKVFPKELQRSINEIVNGTYNPKNPFLGVF